MCAFASFVFCSIHHVLGVRVRHCRCQHPFPLHCRSRVRRSVLVPPRRLDHEPPWPVSLPRLRRRRPHERAHPLWPNRHGLRQQQEIQLSISVFFMSCLWNFLPAPLCSALVVNVISIILAEKKTCSCRSSSSFNTVVRLPLRPGK